MTRELRLGLLTLAGFLGLTVVAVGPSDMIGVAEQVAVVAVYATIAAYGIGAVTQAIYPALEVRFGITVAAVVTGAATLVMALCGVWVVFALARATGTFRRRARSV